jgi:lipopolysaccharide/colanic/teichoic acid biosynthesis glycosyltransferase
VIRKTASAGSAVGSASALDQVSEQGSRVRTHKYLRDLRAFTMPVIAAICGGSLIYAVFFISAGRSDWRNFGIALTIFAFIPIVSALVLTAVRRNAYPVVSALSVTIILALFAITLLSAIRLPLSYSGFASVLPFVVLVMAYANVKFNRAGQDRFAIAAFPGAEQLQTQLPGRPPIITHTDDNLGDIEYLLIDPAHHHTREWLTLLERCYLSNIEVLPWTRTIEVQLGRVDIKSFEVSHISYSPTQLAYARLKRFLDIAAVILSLPLTLPLAGCVAAYIFLRDGGPVIFVQDRRGLGKAVFRMYKFRTMYKDVGGAPTTKNDHRIIPGCGLIRMARLDELPQLLNILRGDMSLVGPRPAAEYLARITESAEPKVVLRSLVLPGITGWAQVTSGYASTTEEEIEKLAYDLYYIKYLSFDIDVQILFRTIRTVLSGHGAR